MIRKQRHILSAIVLASAAIPVSATIIIDPFTMPVATSVTAGGANPKSSTASTANNAPLALGGQRELLYRRMFGSSSGRLNANTDNTDALTFATGSNGVANGLVVWDGAATGTTRRTNGAVTPAASTSAADAAAKVHLYRFGAPDTYALGGIDLTEGGANDRIRLSAYADNAGTELVMRFFISPTKYAEGVINIPGAPVFVYQNFDILYTSFTPVGFGVGESILSAFTGVNAITLQLNGGASTDASFDFFASTPPPTPAPEPATMGMIGGGLLLLAFFRLRSARQRFTDR